MAKIDKFPDDVSVGRIRDYQVNESLLRGDHYSAFNIQAGEEFSERYGYLRYLTCNYAGLISKVIADVLFGEKVEIESADKKDEENGFIKELMYENKLDVQLYESELFNSARGDAVFRIRVDNGQIKIDDINPAMYFPEVKRNWRDEPDIKTLAWKEQYGKDTYLIKEIHTVGKINYECYKMKSDKDQEIEKPIAWDVYLKIFGKDIEEEVETGIEEIPIVHIPNVRMRSEYFGTSDYYDLQSLFFAINNRMTKIDNILDKHSDPILALPEGILDENGRVKKEALGMVEVREGEGKPEYIVWNANLESAFSQIDELVKTTFLMSEISPDVVGIDTKGAAESGRALKIRMLRTLAKKNRKALYYEWGIKKVVEIASMFAREGALVGDVKYKGEPIVPVVTFSDGVIDDKVEEIQNETLKLNAGITSKKEAIKTIEDVNDEEAQSILDEIEKDKKSNADFSIENLFHNRTENLSSEDKNNDTKGSGKES